MDEKVILDSKNQSNKEFKFRLIYKGLISLCLLSAGVIFVYDWIELLKIKELEPNGVLICFWSPWMNSNFFIPIFTMVALAISLLVWLRNDYKIPIDNIDRIILVSPVLILCFLGCYFISPMFNLALV